MKAILPMNFRGVCVCVCESSSDVCVFKNGSDVCMLLFKCVYKCMFSVV